MTGSGAAKARPQTWSAETYDSHARFVSDLAADAVAWLAPRRGEAILDLGCGDGVLTAMLAAAGARVVGIDSSESMIARARERSLDVRLGDGENLEFESEFDAVFSNAALHWMTNAGSTARGVARALKPGGRFVAEFGGHGNVAAIVTAMRAAARIHGGDESLACPWYFPTPEAYGSLLARHGFEVSRIGLFPRPTTLNSGMAEWLQLFRKPFFDQFGADGPRVLDDVIGLLRPSLCDSAGKWTADYVRLRVEARKS